MTEVGLNYGQALYTLAKDEGLSKEVLDQLTVLQQSFSQEPDFLRLLSVPDLDKQERCQILEDCLRDKVHPYVLNFLKILTEKGCVKAFDSCVTCYVEQYNEDNGILPVLAVTAVALTQEQQKRLQEKLQQVTKKTVQLQNRVDPDCLGGVRLDFDGKRVDGTVKNRLETLRGQLNNTVL